MTEDRTSYIGSSDASDILSGNWQELWEIKTGRREPPNLDNEFRVQLGKHTEDFHIDWSVAKLEEEGLIIKEIPDSRQQFFRAKQCNIIGCHVDTIVQYRNDAGSPVNIPLEAKHSSGDHSVDDLMQWYMPQVQHQLLCTGRDLAIVSVILGNLEPDCVWVGRSQTWIDIYLLACRRFWEHVEQEIPPGNASPVVITEEVRDKVPINGQVRVNGEQSRAFMGWSQVFVNTKAAAQAHDKAKKILKDMMKPEWSEIYSPRLRLKRSKNGAVTFKIEETDE